MTPGSPPPHHHGAHTRTAVTAQAEATVIGWIDGEAVGRELLDERVERLRDGPRSAMLPAIGSGEDRQLIRWTAHVLFTERICRDEADRRGLDATRIRALDPIGAVQLGSINTAAWRSCPKVGAVFEAVAPAGPPAPTVRTQTRPWYRVEHVVAPTAEEAGVWPLRSIGWTTLRDLPSEVAEPLLASGSGIRVGPVRSELGWHVASIAEVEDRAVDAYDTSLVDTGERLRAFARWLDLRRSRSLRTVDGFEHPGDPAQPDNTHRH